MRVLVCGVLISLSLSCAPEPIQAARGPSVGRPEASGQAPDIEGGASSGAWSWLPDDAHGSWLFVPAGGAPKPMIVLLHGCDETAAGFANAVRATALAAGAGVAILVPEQPRSAHPRRCWTWWNDFDAGAPELTRVVRAVEAASRATSVDASRVYAVGFGEGAAMAVALGTTAPDRFAAIAAHSGLEFDAATGASDAAYVMQHGGRPADEAAAAAVAAMGPSQRKVPAIFLHGTFDETFSPVAGVQAFEQWRLSFDLLDDGVANGSVPGASHAWDTLDGRQVEHEWLAGPGGVTELELVLVSGLGHAWSGGRTDEAFAEPGPDAAALVWRFLAQHRLRPAS